MFSRLGSVAVSNPSECTLKIKSISLELLLYLSHSLSLSLSLSFSLSNTHHGSSIRWLMNHGHTHFFLFNFFLAKITFLCLQGLHEYIGIHNTDQHLHNGEEWIMNEIIYCHNQIVFWPIKKYTTRATHIMNYYRFEQGRAGHIELSYFYVWKLQTRLLVKTITIYRNKLEIKN